ncbi:PREDICTED: microsomal triglyceride transfer protein large subunit [Polistes dominula]|uniref:Microsomal triglyceride transfer protein large subunit n=1 Tax=Polistes dominula TaxID=743375 RepID=A0ABM1J3A8_POLDO|nr:PREDICTED: microsomal triglyceride transfer protein large subunit [Polistes dominula]XP_015186944.1 PREDICTED: microsomal triglyceride transfer protein large subunit [Polistes dominula]XP_015186945.1 PREDICTED: microsomal triglyceride transfer protein large subunit [Polistes dominula]
MACLRKPPVTTLTVYLVYLLALFGSYCQMAPAVAGATKGWDVGSGLKYELTTIVLFREAGPSKSAGDVGFQLTAELDVTAVWRDPNDPESLLLNIEILSPQLLIKSRKAPEPEGFVKHSSKVDEISQKPVIVLWKNGEIRAIYLDESESISSKNLKRGLASIFQYKTLDDEIRQKDASGLCTVSYVSMGPKTILKTKSNCKHSLTPKKQHPDFIFGVNLVSSRKVTYELSSNLLPTSIKEEEEHELTLVTRPELGSIVTSKRLLVQIPKDIKVDKLEANSVKHAVALLQPGYRETNIELEMEPFTCPDSRCPMLEQTVEENRESLNNAALGTTKSASAFLKLLPLVKRTPSDQLEKLLKVPRYRQLKPQLLDLYGSASTPAAHQAAMKILKKDEKGDDTERYLWALSMSPTPDADIAKDILKRSEDIVQNDKVSETFALTAAAIARHYGNQAVIEKARVSLELGLDACILEDCKIKYLRAFRNLRSKETIPILLKYATEENRAISVVAWRALTSLPREYITSDVKEAAFKTLYQIGGSRKDSSARTLALDIILDNGPSKDELEELVKFLANTDVAYEIRKYLNQRFEQLSEKNETFARNLKENFNKLQQKINNYNVLAQKGLSTAFSRSFLKSVGSNGSLVTVQEINGGLLKRGTVNVVLETNGQEETMFSLGLFARGLSSFVSSGQDENTDADEEATATAGMEIDLLGVGIRPFVFFSGQGELMGHVWSGTASERTPAYQAITTLHSHSEYLPLAAGFVTEMDVQGAMSFDLAGQIQLSLWSRNANSLVDMSAGIVIQGGSKLRSNFVQSMAEFSLTMEPKLELTTDVDFSGQVSLCMRLSQPDTMIRQQVYKIERIPGSRHRLRKTRRIKLFSPGRSYLLNKKNNEMCSKVYS